jgi:hypothetical protein
VKEVEIREEMIEREDKFVKGSNCNDYAVHAVFSVHAVYAQYTVQIQCTYTVHT